MREIPPSSISRHPAKTCLWGKRSDTSTHTKDTRCPSSFGQRISAAMTSLLSGSKGKDTLRPLPLSLA